MIVDVAQRWHRREGSWRPAGERFDPRCYEVASLASDATARAFVEAHHYSGSYPAARFRFGLHERGGALVGVAVFSVPMRAEVLRPFPAEAATELGRFVLLDRVPGNAESWFLARCLHDLTRRGVEGVVSFSDPEPRAGRDGAVVFRGHVGTIYQASNAIYRGRATPRTLRLFDDGTVLSARAISKVRAGERGWRYVVEQLVSRGAPSPSGDLAAWLPRALDATTRTQRHSGNHRYLFPLTRAARRLAGLSLSYPKFGGVPDVCAA